MRSIFLKIFLSFWVTQALFLVLALVLAERPSERVIMRWHSLTADALKLYDQNAVSFLEKGQPEKATAYLQQLEHSADVQFFWFDPRGNLLFGDRRVPRRIHELALHVGGTGQQEFVPTQRATLGGQVAMGADGRRYVLVAQ